MKAAVLAIKQSAFDQILQVDGERGGVHGHQGVGFVARGEHRGAAKVDLERRDARNGPDRGADFRRVIRKGGNGIGNRDTGIGETFTNNLHSVAGITGKTDYH